MIRWRRKSAGEYVSESERITIQDMSDRSRSWVAYDAASRALAHGESFREVKRKLDRLDGGYLCHHCGHGMGLHLGGGDDGRGCLPAPRPT